MLLKQSWEIRSAIRRVKSLLLLNFGGLLSIISWIVGGFLTMGHIYPVTSNNCRLTKYRFDKANSVVSCAVFFLRPR